MSGTAPRETYDDVIIGTGRDGVFPYPTLAESLNNLFAGLA